MVLPPVETTPILLIRFTTKATPALVSLVKDRLKSWNLIVCTEEANHVEDASNSSKTASISKNQVVIGLAATQSELEHEAEARVYCKRKKTGLMDYFTVDDREEFENCGTPDFFAFCERSQLIESLLRSLPVLTDGESSSDLSRELERLGATLSQGGKEESGEPFSLQQVLVKYGFVDRISPVHYAPERDRIVKEVMKITSPMPVRAIRDYYGEEVAFYFAWMSMFTKWLCFPAVASALIYIARNLRGDTVDTCIFTPFFGVGMFLWFVLFLRFWNRRENELAYEWGTFSSRNGTGGYIRRFFKGRPEFKGEMRKSPITGEMEKYYPRRRRMMSYLYSAAITTVLLGCSFTVMIISLNLQGYVHPKHDSARWGEDHFHPFHFPAISRLSEEGQTFDSKSPWRCLAPVIMHAIAIMLMNNGYRSVAENLTHLENHETEVEHQNSLILKRICFEAFDAYMSLIYLAFFERDMTKIRGELVTLFNVSVFRRLLVEYVIPMVSRKLGERKKSSYKDSVAQKKKSDDHKETTTDEEYSPLSLQADLQEYELFDDYLEMVIELGYLCLFASVYPFASFVAIFSHMIEARSDLLQISFIYRKMSSTRTDSIGTWNLVMSCIVWISALTNCLIFAYTSRQMMQWMPGFFYIAEDGDQDMVEEKEWIVVFILFFAERILLFIGIIINLVISKVPSHIEEKVQHEAYVTFMEARELRILQRSKEENADKKATTK